MQRDLLGQFPHANLHVYAIWFDMLASDSRSRWPPTLLTDPRVVHRWDESKTVGQWYAQHVSTMRGFLTPGSAWGNGSILWDSWLLYGTHASWNATPTGLIHWGRTIVASRDTLKTGFDHLFAAPK